MRLRCLAPYRNATIAHEPGAVFEVTPEERLFLKADSPGTFEDVVEEPEVKEPPVDDWTPITDGK